MYLQVHRRGDLWHHASIHKWQYAKLHQEPSPVLPSRLRCKQTNRG